MPGSRVPPACHHQLEDQHQPGHRQHGRGNRQRGREGAGKLISSGHFEPSLLFFVFLEIPSGAFSIVS